MGGGASISVMPTHQKSSDLRKLLRDKFRLNKLYKQICNHGHEKGEGRIYLKHQVSLPELILYMNKEDRDPVLHGFSSDPEVIKVAFRHCDKDRAPSKRKGGKADYKNDQLSKREFRKLLPTLFLFTHLFVVFDVGDCAVHDRKIFPKEFLTGKSKIEAIDEVTIADVTDEQWSNEFPIIDKNKNGYISFDEFCAYVVKNVIEPQFFAHVDADESDSDAEITPAVEGEETAVTEQPAAATETNTTSQVAVGIAEIATTDEATTPAIADTAAPELVAAAVVASEPTVPTPEACTTPATAVHDTPAVAEGAAPAPAAIDGQEVASASAPEAEAEAEIQLPLPPRNLDPDGTAPTADSTVSSSVADRG